MIVGRCGTRPQPTAAPRCSPSLSGVHAEGLRQFVPARGDLEAGSAEAVLRDVCRWSILGSGDIEALRSPGEAATVVTEADAHGLLGPLVAATTLGAVELSAAETERARDLHAATMEWCMILERRLLDIDEAFARAGAVRYLVVKGPAVAHLDEADPSLRSFGDLDLLVAGDDMDRALALIAGLGATRRLPERRAGFDRRFVKGVGTAYPDGIEIDVHRTLCCGALGHLIPLDDIFANSEPFDLVGRRIPAPSATHRMLHACYHAMVGSAAPPLRTVRDIAVQLLCGPTPEAVAAQARLWTGDAVLAAGVRAAIDTFAIDAPEWDEWLARTVIDPAGQRLLDAAHDEPGVLLDRGVLRVLPWSQRLPYLWAVAFPSAEVLAQRDQSRLARVTDALSREARALPRRAARLRARMRPD